MFRFGKEEISTIQIVTEFFQKIMFHATLCKTIGLNVNEKGENTIRFAFVFGCCCILKAKIPIDQQNQIWKNFPIAVLQSIMLDANSRNILRLENFFEEFTVKADDSNDVISLLIRQHLDRLGITDPIRREKYLEFMDLEIGKILFNRCVQYLINANKNYKFR